MLSQTAAEPKELAKSLHPRLRRWFRKTYPSFTHAQLLCVPAILNRESILLTSPTGSGKTLAGFLGVFDYLLRKLDAGTLRSTVQC
ncbi:MAG: DEAD/DEAH box helicase, partial [Chthoniobacterales bacterium]|nr:DEAD/DEAH box helicase [Chthoniobacterales bacterium]